MLTQDLDVEEKDIQLKWLPLTFEKNNIGIPPSIDKWLWLALIEIDPPEL